MGFPSSHSSSSVCDHICVAMGGFVCVLHYSILFSMFIDVHAIKVFVSMMANVPLAGIVSSSSPLYFLSDTAGSRQWRQLFCLSLQFYLTTLSRLCVPDLISHQQKGRATTALFYSKNIFVCLIQLHITK